MNTVYETQLNLDEKQLKRTKSIMVILLTLLAFINTLSILISLKSKKIYETNSNFETQSEGKTVYEIKSTEKILDSSKTPKRKKSSVDFSEVTFANNEQAIHQSYSDFIRLTNQGTLQKKDEGTVQEEVEKDILTKQINVIGETGSILTKPEIKENSKRREQFYTSNSFMESKNPINKEKIILENTSEEKKKDENDDIVDSYLTIRQNFKRTFSSYFLEKENNQKLDSILRIENFVVEPKIDKLEEDKNQLKGKKIDTKKSKNILDFTKLPEEVNKKIKTNTKLMKKIKRNKLLQPKSAFLRQKNKSGIENTKRNKSAIDLKDHKKISPEIKKDITKNEESTKKDSYSKIQYQEKDVEIINKNEAEIKNLIDKLFLTIDIEDINMYKNKTLNRDLVKQKAVKQLEKNKIFKKILTKTESGNIIIAIQEYFFGCFCKSEEASQKYFSSVIEIIKKVAEEELSGFQTLEFENNFKIHVYIDKENKEIAMNKLLQEIENTLYIRSSNFNNESIIKIREKSVKSRSTDEEKILTICGETAFYLFKLQISLLYNINNIEYIKLPEEIKNLNINFFFSNDS